MRPKKLHADGDCEAMLTEGRLCAYWGMFKMTRIDGTTKLFCTRHANALRDEHLKHPENFTAVKWSTVK